LLGHSAAVGARRRRALTGSGTMESGCKHVIGVRLLEPVQFPRDPYGSLGGWDVEGARAVARVAQTGQGASPAQEGAQRRCARIWAETMAQRSPPHRSYSYQHQAA